MFWCKAVCIVNMLLCCVFIAVVPQVINHAYFFSKFVSIFAVVIWAVIKICLTCYFYYFENLGFLMKFIWHRKTF